MDRRSFTLAALALGAAPTLARPDRLGPIPPSILQGPWRTPENKVRDPFRHPEESLAFWGLAGGMTVVEIEPSGGYWTELLAPFLAATHGRYVAAMPGDPTAFKARYADEAVFGDIEVVPFDAKSGPLVPHGTADLILTARNFHDWMWTPGLVAKYLTDFHAALKPHAILAVEEHRADPRARKSTPTQRIPRPIHSASGRCRRPAAPTPRIRRRRPASTRPSTRPLAKATG